MILDPHLLKMLDYRCNEEDVVAKVNELVKFSNELKQYLLESAAIKKVEKEEESVKQTNTKDILYTVALPLIEEFGNRVVFGGTPENATWGEHEEFGVARAIEGTKFVFDRRYWEMLGKPDKLIIGMANQSGWDKRVRTDSVVISWKT